MPCKPLLYYIDKKKSLCSVKMHSFSPKMFSTCKLFNAWIWNPQLWTRAIVPEALSANSSCLLKFTCVFCFFYNNKESTDFFFEIQSHVTQASRKLMQLKMTLHFQSSFLPSWVLGLQILPPHLVLCGARDLKPGLCVLCKHSPTWAISSTL